MEYSYELRLAVSLQMQDERRAYQHKLVKDGYPASAAFAAVGYFCKLPALFLPFVAVLLCEIGLGAVHKGGEKKLAKGKPFDVAVRALDAEYTDDLAQNRLLVHHRERIEQIKYSLPTAHQHR